MNKERRIMKKKNSKRKRKLRDQNSLFPLLLSALFSKSDTNKPLIRKCLNKISISLPHLLSAPILSLLPTLLKSNSSEIACKSAEIVGAASLVSIEMNEKIVMEDEIVKVLISLLGSSKREIALAACNAILDLSTTAVGRQRLLGFSAIDNLLLCFIQASKSSAAVVSVAADMLLFKDNEYLALLLQGAMVLINSCTTEMLQQIPVELSDAFLLYLKRLWVQAHKQSLCSTSSKCNQRKDLYKSNIRTNNLAESIFRLSINCCSYAEPKAFDWVEKSIFSLGEMGIEQFLSTIWESSPMLTRDASKKSRDLDNIFGPFIQFLGSKEAIPLSLPSILKCTIHCPPIASDELDILHVIKEVKDYLGCPIVYQQDIRVVKTQRGESELHYFQNESCSSCTRPTQILQINEIMRCEEAFRNGYSIALRGLEFRFQTVAAIADRLASFFGQPSAGVNMYLTPPHSQGLARHSDDHCVFVCQLIGVKRWTIFPRPTSQLPRLYEPSDESCGLETEGQPDDGCRQYLLKEGDVLYIPRGFPHEARTDVDDCEYNDDMGFSLHLTLAVEIEPPFEWEGFMQVALYTWDKKQKALQHTSGDPLPPNLHALSVMLLHVAMKLLGNLDSTFRKACLIGAMPMSSVTTNWLCNKQQSVFKSLISKITMESKFSGVVEHVEAAMQKNEDPLEQLKWMKYLADQGEIERSYPDTRYLFDILNQHQDMVETAFTQVKSKFCGEVEFEDVERQYKSLLDRYRKVRKQYANGMLSLHCTVGNEHETTSL